MTDSLSKRYSFIIDFIGKTINIAMLCRVMHRMACLCMVCRNLLLLLRSAST